MNGLDIEIDKETQKTYAHLTVEEVEKHPLSKVFEDLDDIKTRKTIVNVFIRNIIKYCDRIVITYNFQENIFTERFFKTMWKKQKCRSAMFSQSASSFSLSSYLFPQSAPKTGCGVCVSFSLAASWLFGKISQGKTAGRTRPLFAEVRTHASLHSRASRALTTLSAFFDKSGAPPNAMMMTLRGAFSV